MHNLFCEYLDLLRRSFAVSAKTVTYFGQTRIAVLTFAPVTQTDMSFYKSTKSAICMLIFAMQIQFICCHCALLWITTTWLVIVILCLFVIFLFQCCSMWWSTLLHSAIPKMISVRTILVSNFMTCTNNSQRTAMHQIWIKNLYAVVCCTFLVHAQT